MSGSCEMRGAAVGQVVAIDRGDNDMLQAESRYGLCYSARLVGVERAHLAVRDRPIRTIARAHIAHQHEGRGTMRKAFANVGAACFLADGMQLQLGENRLGAEVLR